MAADDVAPDNPIAPDDFQLSANVQTSCEAQLMRTSTAPTISPTAKTASITGTAIFGLCPCTTCRSESSAIAASAASAPQPSGISGLLSERLTETGVRLVTR